MVRGGGCWDTSDCCCWPNLAPPTAELPCRCLLRSTDPSALMMLLPSPGRTGGDPAPPAIEDRSAYISASGDLSREGPLDCGAVKAPPLPDRPADAMEARPPPVAAATTPPRPVPAAERPPIRGESGQGRNSSEADCGSTDMPRVLVASWLDDCPQDVCDGTDGILGVVESSLIALIVVVTTVAVSSLFSKPPRT